MFTLVNSVAGSHLYGLNHKDSDLDTMGITIASLKDMVSLTPPDQIGKDDHVLYELRRWVQLAAKGNPTILQMLWVPQASWQVWHDEWARIQQELKPLVLSQTCRTAFIGYLQQQRKKMLDKRNQRQSLIDQFGYDTKFAMHAVRLGFQGLEVLQNQHMQLPMNLAHHGICQAIRFGEWTQSQVIELIGNLEYGLQKTESELPLTPDYDRINDWLAQTYKEFWRNGKMGIDF